MPNELVPYNFCHCFWSVLSGHMNKVHHSFGKTCLYDSSVSSEDHQCVEKMPLTNFIDCLYEKFGTARTLFG